MAVVQKMVDFYNNWMSFADPRVTSFPFMTSPIPTIAITFFYLYFVLKLGPDFMKNRKPYNIQGLIILYNGVQVFLSFWLCLKFLLNKSVWRGSWRCEPVQIEDNSPENVEMMSLIYTYYVLKLVELLDTVFFVLRKNFYQVSLLHVWHHFSMPYGTWYVMKFVPGGHTWFYPMINSFIHGIMYSYYLLTAFDSTYKKSNTWKKRLTQMQMTQLMLIFLFYAQTVIQPSCRYPFSATFCVAGNAAMVFTFFINFYYKSYWQAKKKIT